MNLPLPVPNSLTIAEIKMPAQSLWDFLWQIPLSLEANIFYALLMASLFGMLVNYIRLWLTDQIIGNFFAYLFLQYPKRTLLSMFGAAAWSIGEVATGVYQGPNGELFGWGLILISGFKNGFTGDALANKGAAGASAAASQQSGANQPKT